MKRTLFRLGILLPILFGCTARAAEIGDFKMFTSKAGRFSAEFPGDPTPTEQQVDTKVGKMTIHLFVVRIGNQFEYSTAYNDLPGTLTEQQIKTFDVDAALVGARDGITGGTKTKAVKESNISLNNKWPGREWELKATGDANEDFRWRCFIVNRRRQYQICVGWLKGHEPPKEIVDKFLDSLKITAE